MAKSVAMLGLSTVLLATAGCSSSSSSAAATSSATPTTETASSTTVASTSTAETTTVAAAPTTSQGTEAAANTVAPAWKNSDAKPFTDVSVTNGVALLYVTDANSHLLLEAISADGKTLWTKPATRSATCHCLPARPPMIRDGHVIYLKQVKSGDVMTAQMVAADPLTGADVAASAPATFGEWPFECAGGKVCSTQHSADDTTQKLVSFDPTSGALSPIGPDQPSDSAVMWGGNEGVFTVSSRGNPDEYVEFIADGTSKWRKPLSTYFPAGFTSRLHWNFAYDAASKTIYGATFPDLTAVGNDFGEPEQGVVVGIAASDGHTSWKIDGEPCEFGQNTAVVCTYSGWDASGQLALSNADTSVARIDPATGKSLWSHAFPHTWVGNFRGSGDSYLTSVSGPSVTADTTLINPVSGDISPAKDGERFVCAVDLYLDFTFGSPPGFTGYGRGGRTTHFCNIKGDQVGGDGAPSELLGAGTTFGSVKVFVQDSQVVAYRA